MRISLKFNSVFSIFASAALMLISSCSQPLGSEKTNVPVIPIESSISNLLNKLPSPYDSWTKSSKTGACSIDPAITIDKNLVIRGWGVVNAVKGEVPEAFILVVRSGDVDRFLVTNLENRNDIVTRFDNPKLLRSGFAVQLPASKVKPPIRLTLLLGFQDQLFSCEHKSIIR